VSRAAFFSPPNPISQSRILKSPGAVMYSNKWTSGSWFDWKLVYRYMKRRLNVVFSFQYHFDMI
jgi:hypothetical protein